MPSIISSGESTGFLSACPTSSQILFACQFCFFANLVIVFAKKWRPKGKTIRKLNKTNRLPVLKKKVTQNYIPI